MTGRWRERYYNAQSWPAQWETRYNGQSAGVYNATATQSSIQRTYSEDTLWPVVRVLNRTYYARRGTKFPYDVGSSFVTLRCDNDLNPRMVNWSWGKPSGPGWYYRFAGPQSANGYTMTANTSSLPSYPDGLTMVAAGTSAIARCAPTAPHANTLTAITELVRDTPRATLRSLSQPGNRLRGGADDYLNWEFGIKPTISDLTRFISTAQNAQAILRQYRRDNGKLIRRRYSFPPSITTTQTVESTSATAWPVLPTSYYASTGRRIRENRTQVDTWFSGAFTYYTDPGDSAVATLRRQLRELNLLYGALPTADVAWNLLPWSWAADWFTNLGDVIRNVSMFVNDGLVLKYGYVMRHTVATTQWTLAGCRLLGGYSLDCHQTKTLESKVRSRATPFGFGVDESSLSPRQWAILAALGLTRTPGKLP